ncbi:hypothetical protein Q7C36_009925 [Tachysurus vachellii]|uniref:Uncharacterized protein n=1 Tax=Tachysurus vachellii TaxID=175792 RepID=A0AA88N2Y1_TACVA|nr:hypothetical protein Q7C36_009925 [Tachysurus vachellii]
MECLPFRRSQRRRARRHQTCAYRDPDSEGLAYLFYRKNNNPYLECCFSCRKLALEVDLSAYEWIYHKLGREPQRSWRSFPPCITQYRWVTLLEKSRPIPLILSHADIMLEGGSWVAAWQPDIDYQLTDKLVLRVHTHELRRCITVASFYGPKTRHAYLISRNIQQSSTRQYYSLFFCGYQLWTTYTKGLVTALVSLPTSPEWVFRSLQQGRDSEVVAILTGTYFALTFPHVWFSLENKRRIKAPLPRWIYARHYNHYWWWP